MAKKDGFKGGTLPTGLGKGQCGFDNVKSHTGTYTEAPSGKTVEVGREVTVGMDAVQSGGRGKGK